MFSRRRGYQIHKPLEILFYVYVKTPPGSPAPPSLELKVIPKMQSLHHATNQHFSDSLTWGKAFV